MPAPEQGGQFGLDTDDTKKAGGPIRLEFDQQVYIAVLPSRPFQDRPEQRQATDVVSLAECCQRNSICEKPVRHHSPWSWERLVRHPEGGIITWMAILP